jgi:RNA polymerase sigma factor (sigma-70 family)
MEASPTNDSNRLPPVGAGSRMLLVQPDAVLCKLCMRGSDDAFAVLHARYRQQVFAFVFHLLGRGANNADVEDLTQETFSKAFAGLRERRSEGSFKSWLFVIARNRTFDHLRSSKPHSIQLDDPEAPEQADNVVNLAADVERRAELAWLVTAMGELPERQREALVMRELGGMSYGDIADSLETNSESVKQLIKRGRATVSEAAEDSGFRSRKLGRELALAAPIAPIIAGGLGVGTASASAAVGGAGLLAAGSKVAATVAAVVVIGGGTAVVGEKVAGGGSGPEETAAAAPAVENSNGSGWGVGGTPPGAAVSEEARERAAERREQAKEKRAKAKRKRAKARAKVKREKAQRAAKAKAKAKGLNAQSAAPKANGNSSGGGGGNQQSASPKKSAPVVEVAPQVEETAPSQGNGNGGSQGQGGSKK